ncbi:MAG: DUF4383 domain-containing protein [Actinomycetota bacterium]|nr:DUF4383 domain-containing protein [Actinomycetota bacterium]
MSAVVNEHWTPARLFFAASSFWHVVLGTAGLVIDRTFPLSRSEAAGGHSEHIFGVFETNGWHSLAALLLGLVSVYFLARPARARDAALAVGVAHLGLVAALMIWQPTTFLIASNAADQVVHASTAVAGILSGAFTSTTTEHAIG